MTMVTGLFKDQDSAEIAFPSPLVDLGYDKSDCQCGHVRRSSPTILSRPQPRPQIIQIRLIWKRRSMQQISTTQRTTRGGGPVGGTGGTLAPVVAAMGVLLIPSWLRDSCRAVGHSTDSFRSDWRSDRPHGNTQELGHSGLARRAVRSRTPCRRHSAWSESALGCRCLQIQQGWQESGGEPFINS